MVIYTKRYLAIDLGAESGRLVLGTLEDETINLEVIHRFKTGGTHLHGRMYWNLLRFYDSIIDGIANNVRILSEQPLEGIGIDSWGVDFVLLDAHDQLAGIPYHYRDNGMLSHYDGFMETINRERLYSITGMQFMALNTSVQLFGLRREGHSSLEIAKTFLMVPDYFNFLFSGEKACEYTDASTTQLLDARKRAWAAEIIEQVGADPAWFLEPTMPCKPLGHVHPALSERYPFIKGVPIHLVGSHDTASAVVGTPLSSGNDAYLSSGTWSLLGMELDEPILTREAMERNFTNEGGVERKIRFLKNIMGLWLLQQSRAAWHVQTGVSLDYNELVQEALKASDFPSIIFPDDPRFLNPPNMLEAIRDACKETGQEQPGSIGEFAITIFRSLALRYRQVLEDLEALTGRHVAKLHVVGGGSQNELLCQFTANAINRDVVAGPVEATATGNLLVQGISNGDIKDVKHGRTIVKNSFPVKIYEPRNVDAWENLYQTRYLDIFSRE